MYIVYVVKKTDAREGLEVAEVGEGGWIVIRRSKVRVWTTPQTF